MSILLTKKQYEAIDNTFNWADRTQSKAAQLFRFKTDIPVWKTEYQYNITTDYAEGDGILPRGSREVSVVNANTEPVTTKILTLGRAFVLHREEYWAVQDGQPLDATGAEIARNRLDLDIDNIAFKGVNGAYGLTSLPGTQEYTAPNGAGGSPLWKNKTGAEILVDIRAMLARAKDKGKYSPDSLAVTPSLYQAMETATVGQDNIRSVVEYVRNEMGIAIHEVEALEKSTSLGTDAAVVFDSTRIDLILPMIPTRDSNAEGFDEAGNFQAPFFAVCGGLKVIEPKSILMAVNVGE